MLSLAQDEFSDPSNRLGREESRRRVTAAGAGAGGVEGAVGFGKLVQSGGRAYGSFRKLRGLNLKQCHLKGSKGGGEPRIQADMQLQATQP